MAVSGTSEGSYLHGAIPVAIPLDGNALPCTMNVKTGGNSMETIVREDGYIAIPSELREELGFSVGTHLKFSVVDGNLLLHKVEDDDPVSRVMGCLKSDLGSDEIMAYIRGPV